MDFLRNMSPATKKLLLVGIPIVAVIAFVVILKKPSSSPSSSTPATGSTTPAPYPGTAVDTGQLASYESTITGQLASIESALAQNASLDGTSPTPAAAPTTPAPGTLSVPAAPAAPAGYAYVATPAQAAADVAGGVTLYAYNESGQIVQEPVQGSTSGLLPMEYTAA